MATIPLAPAISGSVAYGPLSVGPERLYVDGAAAIDLYESYLVGTGGGAEVGPCAMPTATLAIYASWSTEDWLPAAPEGIVGVLDDDELAWMFGYFDLAGNTCLFVTLTEDGSTGIGTQVVVPSPPPAGERAYYGVQVDVGTGAVNFIESLDGGVTWVLLAAAVPLAGAPLSIYDAGLPGRVTAGAFVSNPDVRIYSASAVYDGACCFAADFTTLAPEAATMIDACGSEWTLAPDVVVSAQVAYAPFEVAVYEVDDLDTELALLTDSYGRTIREPLDDTGSGELWLPRTSTQLAELMADLVPADGDLPAIPVLAARLLQFRLYGQAALTVRPRHVELGVLMPNDEFDENGRITGDGHLGLWDEALIYPARGSDSLPVSDDRIFNWTAPTPVYDHTPWAFATEYLRQDDPSPGWTNRPNGWPTGSNGAGHAMWIGPSVGDENWCRSGTWFLRRDFVVPTGVEQLAIYLTGDNIVDFYFDGIFQATNDSKNGRGFDEATYVTVDVTAGEHTLAAAITNLPLAGYDAPVIETAPLSYTIVSGDTLWDLAGRFYGDPFQWRKIFDANAAMIESVATARGKWNPRDPGHWIFPGYSLIIPGFSVPSVPIVNPTGFLLAAYEAQAGGPVGSPILISDDSWRIVEFPPSPPGMTYGRVVRVQLEEAQARGALLGWDLGFTDLVDSNGNGWEVVTDIATKVNTTMRNFLLKEGQPTYADHWAHPARLRLDAWRKGTRGSIVDDATFHGPTDPDDESTSTLANLTRTISLW